MRFAKTLSAAFFGFLAGGSAYAQEEALTSDLPVIGIPQPGGIAFQPASTSVAHDIHFLDNMLLVIITLIVLFVTALLVVVAIKFRASKGHEAARFTHNTTVEIAWTIVPVVILVIIGAFSLPKLFDQLEVPEADVTIKATGYQWYWGHEYPDSGVYFESYMLAEEDLAEYGYGPETYLLATDTAVVVPVGAVVKLQTTAADVIHSWKIPAFGVHIDAVPGRLNETWFRVDEPGIYFGQCSELCGISHTYMPITVKAVPQDEYDAWLAAAVERYADGGAPVTQVAAAE
ncbi:cytochrome c oxidase subunit 2 [Monaibacterium marinum]|uniref:Cytochrome c oxidase subunit 2 n=1 Tax=Pontivivens marinum TaxID=1690039 RepID=A0A2C9CNK5_9RHOB|nr:cytochrome c oxidase subunit II [Monaibacterium marinum]SOH92812.1 cytochrome c oxidase subunit 2 [Monaibacterium marinum]